MSLLLPLQSQQQALYQNQQQNVGNQIFYTPGAANYNINAQNYISNYQNVLSSTYFMMPQGSSSVYGVKSPVAIGTFAFSTRERERIRMQSEITDHWVEDNIAAQDHIGVKPIQVVLSGYVGELQMSASSLQSILGILTVATNALSQLPVFLGAQTPGSEQLIENAISQSESVIEQVQQSVARAAALAALIPGLVNGPTLNAQQQAYWQLKALWAARIVFTVFTPYETLYNMVIDDIDVDGEPDTVLWTKYTVTLKQLNFINPISGSTYSSSLSSPIANPQGQAQTNNGGTTGAPSIVGSEAVTVGDNLYVPPYVP